MNKNNFTNKLPILFLQNEPLPQNHTYCQPSYTIICIISGKCHITYNASEALYPFGSICIIPPNTPYTVKVDEQGYFLSLGLSPDFIEGHISPNVTIACNSVHEPLGSYSLLRKLVSEIAVQYSESPQKNRLSLQSLLFRLLALLNDKYTFAPFSDNIPEKYAQRAQEIISFIDCHYAEQLTLSQLAEMLFLTPQYLSRFFKNCFHITFHEYLTKKRLFHACRDLAFTQLSVTDIALRCGFSGVAAFSKTFRTYYDISPKEFQKKRRLQLHIEEYNNFEKIAHNDETTGFEPIAPKNVYAQFVRADVRNTVSVDFGVCRLMNIGLIQNLLYEDFQRELFEAKSVLHIRYVRLQGVTSSAFIPKVLPDYTYYFHNLDTVLTSLYEHQLIPFFELSKLPENAKKLEFSAMSFISRGQRFFELLKAMLMHCALIYPKDWLAQWKFELWKPPVDSFEKYLRDFETIQALIKTYIPDADLGGCGMKADIYRNELRNFLENMKLYHIRPGFISMYCNIQTQTDNHTEIISASPDFIIESAKEASDLAKSFYPDVPFYITEWTSIYSDGSPIHYSCFQSAFICKNALGLRQLCSLSGYWRLIDTNMNTQIEKRPQPLWGYGLIASNHLKMPAYHAFSLLNQLGQYEICHGENYCITQSEENHYQILSFNYSHFSMIQTMESANSHCFPNLYDAFEPLPVQQMEFALDGIEPGTYRITRKILSRTHGSILDIFIGAYLHSTIEEDEYMMNFLLPSAAAFQYYQNSCVPEERTIYIKAEHQLTLRSDIYTHNVCFWDIVRLF